MTVLDWVCLAATAALLVYLFISLIHADRAR